MEARTLLLQALQALYHDPSPTTRNAANQWLQDFQQSLEAWQISDSLLHDPSINLEVLYFCAQTLRTKIQRDFDDLPLDSRIHLRDSVLMLLRRFQHGPASVRTQLCLALAGLAMHISAGDWGRGGVVKWLKEELSVSNESVSSFLELLTVLPQEAYSHKTAVKPERRRRFQKELGASTQDAFEALTDLLSRNASVHIVQIIVAFAAWLHLAHGRMNVSTLASHPLVAAALSGLTLDTSFDAAVDAVTELIRFTVSGTPGGLAEQMPLVQIIVPHVMALKSRFVGSLKITADESHSGDFEGEEEDHEIMKGIAQLFTEMGESYVEIIANGSVEAMVIVEALVAVTSHPDVTIAEMAFNFWYRLSNAITTREFYKGFESETAVGNEMERRASIFRPIFEHIISLGGFMSPEAASWNWQSVEASLYCIRGIAKVVPRDEATIMPQVMMLLPRLPVHPQLMYTAYLTIGAYADWLGVASSSLSLLPSLLELLTGGFSIAGDPAAAAALAFKHVCDACRNSLGSQCINALVTVYTEAMGKGSKFQLEAEDELQVVEGLSMVVSAMPGEKTAQILGALCQPMVTSLQEAVTEFQLSGHLTQRVSSHSYTVNIDRLANIYRYVSHAEPLASCFKGTWPVLENVFLQMGADVRTMERLCRLCKYAVRACGRFLGDVVGAVLEQVQERFQQHRQSCFLYLASEVIKVFSADPSLATYLGNLIFLLFGQVVNVLTNIEAFTSLPDIADDCFLLASRCTRYCPNLLVPSPIFAPLVDCAMTGVTIQHREACSSILTFLQDILNLSDSAKGQQYKDVLDSVLHPRGPNLCRILISALVGAVPESRVEEVIGVLESLVHLYERDVVQWAEKSVRLIPVSVASEEEQKAFLHAITSTATGGDPIALRNSIEDLSDVCRRSKKTVELVQSALRPHELAVGC
ncbi:hypothetical protein KP509_07G095100 [Ceratopteris richardii]|uniref:Importin N-terminal domain-containing protein n=1 Tax=Ceratopteris richardii TaxID=49495 RepID=A0A8T2UP01_CERRI|nr:hypothetical protein KP509_07G095100 [Ceratopteris richardii]